MSLFIYTQHSKRVILLPNDLRKCILRIVTFFVVGRRPVDGQRKRDDSGYDENNERDVLQSFPDELQEALGRSRRYDVRTEHLLAMTNVVRRPTQTCIIKQTAGIVEHSLMKTTRRRSIV